MTTINDKKSKLNKVFEDFLRAVGRPPGTYPELLDTPVRAADMWLNDLVDGYEWDPKDILEGGMPTPTKQGMVIIKDMFFHSVCPHHLLPCHGISHVAYVPGDQIIGFSKIARLVDCFAHRLTLQEEIVNNVCNALTEHLGVQGAACVIDAEQLCMIVRGVRKPGSRALTSAYTGVLQEDKHLRMEFLNSFNAEE